MSAPWLMWGSTQNYNALISALPAPGNIQTAQIARISYARPETWSFFFAATITQVPAAALGVIQVDVLFDLVIGVGRSQISMPVFGGFSFSGNGAALANAKKWTSVVLAPEQNDPGPSFRPQLEWFTAQDIQAAARVDAFQGGGGPAVGSRLGVQVEAFFAPRAHVRPEWFEQPPRFPGGENKGM